MIQYKYDHPDIVFTNAECHVNYINIDRNPDGLFHLFSLFVL